MISTSVEFESTEVTGSLFNSDRGERTGTTYNIPA